MDLIDLDPQEVIQLLPVLLTYVKEKSNYIENPD